MYGTCLARKPSTHFWDVWDQLSECGLGLWRGKVGFMNGSHDWTGMTGQMNLMLSSFHNSWTQFSKTLLVAILLIQCLQCHLVTYLRLIRQLRKWGVSPTYVHSTYRKKNSIVLNKGVKIDSMVMKEYRGANNANWWPGSRISHLLETHTSTKKVECVTYLRT